MGPSDGFGGLTGNRADQQRVRRCLERAGLVEGSVAGELVEVYAREDGVILSPDLGAHRGLDPVPVVPGVIAAQDFAIEAGPGSEVGWDRRIVRAARGERMTGRAQANQWF